MCMFVYIGKTKSKASIQKKTGKTERKNAKEIEFHVRSLPGNISLIDAYLVTARW